MKGSPFIRVGDQPALANDSRQFGSASRLAFEPDRLFNPDKRNEKEQYLDAELVQEHRREQDELHRIQYDLLKKNTDEEYKKLVKKMESLRRFDHKHPYSWFGVYRGSCVNCEFCGEYEGCFSQAGREQGLEIMQCSKCRCPMNSHIAVPEHNPFCEQIWKHLAKRDMKDSDIKINYKVLAFATGQDQIHDYGGVVDLLTQLGFSTRDTVIESKLKFEIGLIRTAIIKEGAKDWYVESLLGLLNSIAAEGEWNWQSSKAHINQEFEQAYQLVRRIALELPFTVPENEKVVLILCSGQAETNNLFKFLKGEGQGLLHPFRFVWGSTQNKESLISAQNFFPANFEIQYQIFLLPSVLDSQEAARNSARFRDVLDYNGYTLFMEDISNMERHKFEKIFNQFSASKINFLLGEEILSEKIKRVGIKLAARVGPSRLILPFDRAPDFFAVGQQSAIREAMLALYPEFSLSQRCVLVIRPFAINANFEETIVNLLRINGFVIIKRVKVKLNEAEARYIATLEKIAAEIVAAYVELMTAGVCEIVLVSKRSAIYEAYALCNGCLSGQSSIPSKMFQEAPAVELRKGKDTYEFEFGSLGISKSPVIFNSVRETIGIETVLFGTSPAPQFMTNAKTGEIIRVPSELPPQPLKMPPKMRDSLLKSLRKDPFNYWIFSSKSETITEELAGIFLPECTLFEAITVIVKPGLLHLVSLLRKLLMEHRFHIITERQVLMSKITAAEFVLSCQKILLPKETLKLIIEKYSSDPVHIFCISKVSARKQILSMLADFSFFIENSQSAFPMDSLQDRNLSSILIPVWNNEELILSLLSEPLGNLEESIKSLGVSPENAQRTLSKTEKFTLLEYLVGAFYGVTISDAELNTKIGKLCFYIAEDSIQKEQSWYYSLISHAHPNYVPLLFQYRQYGETILCIQTDMGHSFMTLITAMYDDEQQKMRKKSEDSARKNRKSLVLYLWAKKLTEFILDLAEITTELKGFGQIVNKNGEYQGNYNSEVAIAHEKAFLNEVLTQQHDNQAIAQNVRRLLNSRHQRERYTEGNKRLLPSFSLHGLQEGVRIVEKTDTQKLHLLDQFSFIDPENEKEDLKDMFSLCLYNIVPEMKTKYSMAAEIYFFLLKEEFDHLPHSRMQAELCQLLTDLLAQVSDLDVLEYEIYLRYLIEFSHAPADSHLKNWLYSLIERYPNLKKAQKIDYDEAAGKKRKFLDHKQYYVRKNETSEEVKQRIQKEYINFDLNSLNEPMKPGILYDPTDPLHQRFATIENRANLIREGEEIAPKRTGIYVEFEKNISQKEELLKQKIKEEVEKFNTHKNDQILHETGLEKDLWYRKARGEPRPDRASKLTEAINKEITKFMAFKQGEQQK